MNKFPIAAAALVAALALSGCSQIHDGLTGEASHAFSSATDLDGNWDRDLPWLPEDSGDIRVHESRGEPAVLRLVSDAELDPAQCAEVERLSGPAFDEEWSPDAYVDQAWACGDWTLIPTDDGWYGWTPNDPDEAAQSPVAANRRSEVPVAPGDRPE
jgi:hypothetical protein